MGCDAGVRGVGINDGVLEKEADGFEVGVARAEKKGFSGVEEGTTNVPGRGESIEFIDNGEK